MSKVVKHRINRSSAQWRELFARFDTSGLTIVEFCRRHELCVSSFYRWRQAVSDTLPTSVMAPFVELPPVSSPNTHRWQIELDLGDGVVLRLAR